MIERQSGGKMRVTSGSWDGEKVILRDQVLEVRNVDGRLHIARKPREYGEWNPYVPPLRSGRRKPVSNRRGNSAHISDQKQTNFLKWERI